MPTGVMEKETIETIINADPLLTVAEIAKRLRVDGTTVRRWIGNGTLPAVELPHLNKRRAYRVKSSDLNAVLNSGA